MKYFVGMTDNNWFDYLSEKKPDELNFWQPGGKQSFKAIPQYSLFLFKLHSPLNYIVGGGYFVRHSFLPISLAWEAFGNKNGTDNFLDFQNSIYKYRKTNRRLEPDPIIGCIVLTMPFFFASSDWIPVPQDWKPNIVKGKTYDTNTTIGRNLYDQVQEKLLMDNLYTSELLVEDNEKNRYGSPQMVRPRIGQGAFKIMVTEAYQRRCSVTGEKTLPVLDAAHIKPYTQDGPHKTSNGLLFRKDVHTLFDRGYITINEGLRVEVSKRIKEDFGNGKEYYAFHGKSLAELPKDQSDRPLKQYLVWHNENVYIE